MLDAYTIIAEELGITTKDAQVALDRLDREEILKLDKNNLRFLIAYNLMQEKNLHTLQPDLFIDRFTKNQLMLLKEMEKEEKYD